MPPWVIGWTFARRPRDRLGFRMLANDLSNLPERHASRNHPSRRQTLRIFLGLAAAFFVLLGQTQRCSAAIVISEYVEGSSNNKALEIWNSGPARVTVGTDVDLVVLVYANG